MGRRRNTVEKVKLDEFHYHEALDRSYICANMVEDLLVEHPVIMETPELKELIRAAEENLLEVYQRIGSLQVTLFGGNIQEPDKQ